MSLDPKRIESIIYEPLLEKSLLGSRIIRDMSAFEGGAGLIAANRQNADLDDVRHEVFTRGLFGED